MSPSSLESLIGTMSTHTWIFFSMVEASILLALNLNAFFFFFLFAKNAAVSAMLRWRCFVNLTGSQLAAMVLERQQRCLPLWKGFEPVISLHGPMHEQHQMYGQETSRGIWWSYQSNKVYVRRPWDWRILATIIRRCFVEGCRSVSHLLDDLDAPFILIHIPDSRLQNLPFLEQSTSWPSLYFRIHTIVSKNWKMKSFLVIFLAALCGAVGAFVPKSAFMPSQLAVTRNPSTITMAATERTYIMVWDERYVIPLSA